MYLLQAVAFVLPIPFYWKPKSYRYNKRFSCLYISTGITVHERIYLYTQVLWINSIHAFNNRKQVVSKETEPRP